MLGTRITLYLWCTVLSFNHVSFVLKLEQDLAIAPCKASHRDDTQSGIRAVVIPS